MTPPADKLYERCDPLGDFDSPQTLAESIIALAAMYVGCYCLAFLFMRLLSKKFD